MKEGTVKDKTQTGKFVNLFYIFDELINEMTRFL